VIMKQVGKGRNLIADRFHYRRCRVAHRRDCDAGTEVNQLVSVDVDQDATACPLDEDAERSADARGNGRFVRANSSFERGQLGDQAASLHDSSVTGIVVNVDITATSISSRSLPTSAGESGVLTRDPFWSILTDGRREIRSDGGLEPDPRGGPSR
jgi:hypothetical protein